MSALELFIGKADTDGCKCFGSNRKSRKPLRFAAQRVLPSMERLIQPLKQQSVDANLAHTAFCLFLFEQPIRP